MTSAFAESQIEGLLFDLLETKAHIRLGDLVHIRRLSRARHVSMLEIALDEGRITESLGAEIAAELGIPTRHVQESDGFYDHSDNTLSAYEDSADSMVDGLPDALTRPGVDSAPPLQDLSDPDETGPVSIPPMARVFAEPSLLPPPAQSDDDLDEMTEPRLKRSPLGGFYRDRRRLLNGFGLWWLGDRTTGHRGPLDGIPSGRCSQTTCFAPCRCLSGTGAFSAPTGPRSMLSPDFGSRLGQATRSFGLVLASGKATAADRTVFQQVLNAARTEADSVGDEAWIAYLDVIAGDAAIEHSVADAQVDGLIDFEIDGPPGIIVLYRFIERAGVLKRTRIKQFYGQPALRVHLMPVATSLSSPIRRALSSFRLFSQVASHCVYA